MREKKGQNPNSTDPTQAQKTLIQNQHSTFPPQMREYFNHNHNSISPPDDTEKKY